MLFKYHEGGRTVSSGSAAAIIGIEPNIKNEYCNSLKNQGTAVS